MIYSNLGPDLAAKGAVAGILGTIALGIVAPVFGGTPRLISAPCAPAAAVMAALADERPAVGKRVFARLARALAICLRQTDAKLRALEES